MLLQGKNPDMTRVSAVEGELSLAHYVLRLWFWYREGRMAPRYTYYATGTGRRGHRHIPLQAGQHGDRSSCRRIVPCRLQVNRRIRTSLKRVNGMFPAAGRVSLLSCVPIMSNFPPKKPPVSIYIDQRPW